MSVAREGATGRLRARSKPVFYRLPFFRAVLTIFLSSGRFHTKQCIKPFPALLLLLRSCPFPAYRKKSKAAARAFELIRSL